MKKLLLLLLMIPVLGFSQTFDFTNSDDGWNVLANFTATINPTFYKLTTTPGNGTANNPKVQNDAVGANTADVSWVGVSLRNNDANGPTQMRVRYPRPGGNVFKNITISAGDIDFITYWVDLSGPYWVDVIDEFELIFRNEDGTNYILPDDPISIDFDKIEYAAAPPSSTTLQNEYLFETDDDPEGFVAVNGTISSVSGGILTFVPGIEQYARIDQEDHHVDATNNKYVHITLKNNSPGNNQLRLNNADGIFSNQSMEISVSDATEKTYTFDMTGVTGWDGDITFRVGIGSTSTNQTIDDGSMEFNSIIINNTAPITIQNEYLFETDGDPEGFVAQGGEITGVAGGILTFVPDAGGWARISQVDNHVDATNNKFVHVTIKNNSAANDQLRLNHATGAFPNQSMDMSVNDATEKTYTFDMTGVTNWDGYLTFRVGIASTDNGTANDNGSAEFYSIIINNVAPATSTTWTGTVGTDWNTAGNWDNGVPTSTLDAIIPDVTNDPVIGAYSAETNALTIEAGGSLTCSYQGDLTTYGDFDNDGTFKIESTDDTDNGYSGSYINKGAITGSGTFTFERNLFCTGTLPGVAENVGWHYLSAPIVGLTTSDVPDYFVNAWDPVAEQWVQYFMDPYTNPCELYDPPVLLSGLDAWSINIDESYPDPNCGGTLPTANGLTIEFTGGAAAVQTGEYSKLLYYNTGEYQKWNMLGNPYPSGLDVSQINWGANTVQGIAYFNGCTGNYEYWAIGDGSYVIAPTLGFFVATDDNDIIEITDAARAHDADGYYKSDESGLLTIKATGDGHSDELDIRFMEGTTTGFDLAGDFYKLISTTEGLPQIYTTAGDEKLAINSLPGADIIPMGFTANGSGSYTIEAIETSDFAIVNLEDKVTGQITDLLTGNYTFEYTNGDDPNRFNIHFKSTGIGDVEASQISIWSGDQKIFVQTPFSARGEIAVYNMMGQEVVRTDIEPGLNTIPMNDVNSTYVVKVYTVHSAVTGKVFIR